MPETGDAAEDSYIYGFRLWEAKYYPEAQAQLKKTFETHPDHRREIWHHADDGSIAYDVGQCRNAATRCD